MKLRRVLIGILSLIGLCLCASALGEAAAPEALSVNAARTSLYIGETLPLTVSAQPEGASVSVRWKSSASRVASVSKLGLVSARRAGTAVITATSSLAKRVSASVTLSVAARPKPASVEIVSLTRTPSFTVDVGQTLPLAANIAPEDALNTVTWKSANSRVASVSAQGVVTAKRAGKVVITATSRAKRSVKASVTVLVTDIRLPEAILVSPSSATLEVSQSLALSATVSPATATQTVTWKSSASRVASVSASGVVLARRAGKAKISAVSTYSNKVLGSAVIRVVSPCKPKSLAVTLPPSLCVGETARLRIATNPAKASQLARYASSDASVAKVGEDGLVSALKPGQVTLSVCSARWPKVNASATLRVYDPDVPYEVSLAPASFALNAGETRALSAKVLPASAPQSVRYRVSDASVAKVDEAGRVTALRSGLCDVVCDASNGVSAKAQLLVLGAPRCLTPPALTTDVAGIPANLARIAQVRQSALGEILLLQAAGEITAWESEQRQAVVNRAFQMYAFPWSCEQTVEYWSSKHADRRYYAGVVHYGLPYVQNDNRRFTPELAVAQGYYEDTGKGYFRMTDKRMKKLYVGCDCSSFVAMSQLGTAHKFSFATTTQLAASSVFRRVRSWNALRPGDFFVYGGSHAAMFLYYADDEKRQAMMIEQGGDFNTVTCSVQSIYRYASKGFTVRRRSEFA